jgi:hypothetical protein
MLANHEPGVFVEDPNGNNVEDLARIAVGRMRTAHAAERMLWAALMQ